LKGIEPIRIASVSMALIALPAILVAWYLEVFQMAAAHAGFRSSAGIVALLGIGGTAIATALFYMLIQRAGSIFASLVTYAIPVVAIFWGLIFGESINAVQIACLGMILAGVYLANR
ncbi:MAG: EamA family transporter, partial [Flavisolibacter sp.]